MILGLKTYHPAVTHTGKGRISDLKDTINFYGKTLIVHSKSFKEKQQYRLIQYNGTENTGFYEHQGKEPTFQNLKDLLTVIKKDDYKCIVGIGGGSVLDLAKVAAGLVHAEFSPEFYVNGKVEALGLPFIAVPTTAGSGSESNFSGVFLNPQINEKQTIREENFLARQVILDFEMMEGCPSQIIAHSGLAALSQAVEAYFSRHSCWYAENLALRGFELVIKNLEDAYNNVDQFEKFAPHYRDLMIGSYFIGIATANSRLGIINGLAHPLGVLYDLPFSQACALTLIPALALNKEYVENKYKTLSVICKADLIRQIDYLLRHLYINNPLQGQKVQHPQLIIDATLKPNSMTSNPKPISAHDVTSLLAKIFKGQSC